MAIPLFNIGGLASGLDTNSIISSIINVERIPIQQLEARKYDHEVEDNAWQAIKARYSAIRSALNDLDSASDFSKLAVATSSNESAVSVSVAGSPTTGTTVSNSAAFSRVFLKWIRVSTRPRDSS